MLCYTMSYYFILACLMLCYIEDGADAVRAADPDGRAGQRGPISLFIYIYIYICMYVCMYIYIYICGRAGQRCPQPVAGKTNNIHN